VETEGRCGSGQDGPDDADDSAAAAVLYAAETYLRGCAHLAMPVSGRAVEAVDQLLHEGDTRAVDSDAVPAFSGLAR
jgi:hypothetical protein